ncbi:IclR family transcriptional regulator [Streptomyces sp. UG1]|uniref:IclR family transcriptional regulator n=1 Tax=Streptomyces sp. UG1 TaxID=3417652 RepID=UPI003CF4A1DD
MLWKAFDVLDAFSRQHRVLTLSELARTSGLPKSTVHRVLAMLRELGAVEQVDGGFRMGLRMLTMAASSPEAGLREVAVPHLLELHRAVGHTVHLCALRGDDVVYLEKLHESDALVIPTAVGMRLPAHCTGVGKALLAHRAADADAAAHTPALLRRLTPRSITEPRALALELAQVRQRGMAVDRDEAVPGLSCVARPVLIGGRAVAAVSIGFPSSAAGRGEAWLGRLGRTVGSLSAALRKRPDLMEYLFRSQA